MVRHLKISPVQPHHASSPASSSSAASTTTSSPSSSFFPLSIRPPPYHLFHPLIYETSSNAAAVSDRIPGFKTSAAFLTTLRTNLYLSSSLDPSSDYRIPSSIDASYTNTPVFGPTTMSYSTSSSMVPPSPSQVALAASNDHSSDDPSDPLSSIPPLTTYPATEEADQIAALKLVADSVAQQRQITSSAAIFHPLSVAIWVVLLAIVAQYLYKGSPMDWVLICTTWAGVMTAGLLSIRYLTSGYLEEAEQTGTWKWLGKDSEIIITRFGDEIIGAIIIKFSSTDPNSPSSPSSNKARKKSSKANSRGVIRAWTVKLRYRGKGIGGGLLEEAVRLCKTKGVGTPIFADDHANSKRILPRLFNGRMEKREILAKEMLETVVEEGMTGKERRKRRAS